MAGSLWSNLVTRAAEKVDRAVGWSKLPIPLAMPVLIGLRERLRESNLYDTGRGPARHPAVRRQRHRRPPRPRARWTAPTTTSTTR